MRLSQHVFKFQKVDDDKRLVGGIVYEPDFMDTDDEWTDAEEIEKAAHNFMLDFREMKIMHKNVSKQLAIVESYLAPIDMNIYGQAVKKGAWLITAKVFDDSLWKEIKDGKFTGFSMGGSAARI